MQFVPYFVDAITVRNVIWKIGSWRSWVEANISNCVCIRLVQVVKPLASERTRCPLLWDSLVTDQDGEFQFNQQISWHFWISTCSRNIRTVIQDYDSYPRFICSYQMSSVRYVRFLHVILCSCYLLMFWLLAILVWV